MAELLRIEPSRFCADEAWFVFDDGRSCLRKLDRASSPARSSAYIRRDEIEPCRGADGKMHDSLSSYRRTLRADGNPQGETYIELGNESLKHDPPKFDRRERRDAIRAGIEDVRNGRVPPPTYLED